jgi:hypothetical protein
MQINIYSQDGTLKATVSSSSGDQCVKELQGDSTLSLSFEYYAYVALEVNDYVDFCGDRYWLLSQYHPAEKSSVSWKYDITFYGIESLIKRYLVLEHTDGDANPVFSLTAPALQHVNMIVECLNNATGTEMWTVGEVVSTGNITIDYTGKYCDEGLRELAENAETEYWFDGTAVNLCKCERGERLNLAYGDGVISLERDVADGVKFYTRLYPIGSSRNIDPGKYGHSRLQLPNGAKYVDLEVEKYGVVDHYEQEAFSGIYPRYTGSISEVRVESRTDDEGTKFKVYFFKDAGLPFDPNDYLLPSEKMRVSFQSGELHGLGETDDHYFEVDYNSETSEFEIINIWTDGEQLPYGNLVPAVGDTFIPWNIGMPDEYYDLAELEFQEAVANYNQNHFKDISIYRGTTDHVWIESDENTGKEEVELFVGRRVRLVSSQYFPVNGYRDSRITKITRRVDLPSLMDIEISDVVTKGGQERINDSIKSVREYAKSIEGTSPDLVKTGDDKKFTDSNVLTALRSAREFISRLHDDIIYGALRFKKHLTVDEGITTDNIQSSNYTGDGMADTGYMLTGRDATGSSKLVVDNLYVRKKATFEELEVKKETAVAGNEIRSCAANVILRTDYYDGDGQRMGYSVTTVPWLLKKVPFLLRGRFFGRLRKTRLQIKADDVSRIRRVRCYFLAKDGDAEVENLWQVYDSESQSTTGNDLARCQTMNLKNSKRKTYLQGVEQKAGNVFWWRRLCGKSDDPVRLDDGKWYHYIDVEMNYDLEQSAVGNPPHCMKGSDIPAAGDHVVQFGNDLNPDRMNLIALEVNGADSPAIKGYKGIYTFDLNQCWWGGDPQKMVLSPATGYKFYGPEFYFQIENTLYRQPIDRGEYQTNTRYYYYDRVSHAGSLWLCVVSDGAHWEDAQGNTIPTRTDGATRVRNWTVEEPGTGNAWVKQVAKGVDGTDGDDGYTPRKGVDYYDGDDSYSVVLMPPALIIEQSTTKQNGSYPLVLSNAKTVVKMYKAGTEISVTNITVTSRQGCSTSVSGTTVSITGINSTDVLTGYVDMAVTGDGVTIPARLAFAVNWLGSWKESVIGDTKTEVADKLKFTWNGTTYDTLETIGTFIRSSRENVSKLEEITTTGQDGKRHVKESEVSQYADAINAAVYTALGRVGININGDNRSVDLQADSVNCKPTSIDGTPSFELLSSDESRRLVFQSVTTPKVGFSEWFGYAIQALISGYIGDVAHFGAYVRPDGTAQGYFRMDDVRLNNGTPISRYKVLFDPQAISFGSTPQGGNSADKLRIGIDDNGYPYIRSAGAGNGGLPAESAGISNLPTGGLYVDGNGFLKVKA